MGVVSRKRAAMESLCDEVLGFVLKKLPIRDAIRAQSVCRRWRERVDAEKGHFVVHSPGFCPLVFKRTDEQHTWSGYRTATGKWESLPSLLNVPREVHLLPIAGSGNGLLGFKISQVYTGYVVGNPYSGKWMTLPRSAADSWGDAVVFMFMAIPAQDVFRVVSVRDVDTHIYKSEDDEWTKLGCTPRRQVVTCIRSKACAVVNNRLYTTDGDHLTSFDMRSEQWIDNKIDIPVPKYATQLVECVDTLFAVTEEDDMGRICVWGFGMRSQRFALTVEMPRETRDFLTPAGAMNLRRRAIKSVGHGQHLFFWRQKRLSVVSYNLFTHEWRHLPEIAKPDILADGDRPQVEIDAGFFVPESEFRQPLHCRS